MLELSNIRIVGESVSGIGTAVTLPDLGICLDLGIATEASFKCPTVLITHGHLDHAHGLIRHAYIRHMTGATQKSRFICEPRLEPLIHRLFKLWGEFQMGRSPEYEVVPVSPGEEVRLSQQLVARPFKTHHRIPSQGYVLVDLRQKLKSEFQGLPGPQLGLLKKQGVQITDTVEVPLVAYTGDTKASVFDVESAPLQAKVLFTECTFLGEDEDIRMAQKRGHIHLDELAQRAPLFQNVEALVLYHFSQRYHNRRIEREMAKLPDGLREKTHYIPLAQ